MSIRRTFVFVLSALAGVAAVLAVVAAFQTTAQRFSIGGVLVVFLGAGSLALIWLDYITRTNLLQR
jgi:hypothetical protein